LAQNVNQILSSPTASYRNKVNIQARPALAMGEFVPLMACMISLIALSIDAMLPALPDIGKDLHVPVENDRQLIISALFLGMSLSQLFFGPLSDSIGRKRAIYGGFVLFMAGSLMSAFSSSLEFMLAGRVLQGMGAAGPRIVCMALIRDQYEGREMARIMSFVMSVFVLIPAVAPALGQAIIAVSHWRAIFGAFVVLAIFIWIWFALRQPETLQVEHRVPFSLSVILAGVMETCGNRIALNYTIVAGIVLGAFIGYLTTAQQMFSDIYGVTDMFPLYFAVLALVIGFSSIVNGRLVIRLGMRFLSTLAIINITLASFVFLAYLTLVGGQVELWLNMAYFSVAFLSVGVLFGNLNAMAMEPLGHIAGVGAAVVGSISTLVAAVLGTVIGQLFDGTIVPMVTGFAVLGSVAFVLMQWTERGRIADA
jgi:MFS transporter, DHA1 family, multidrug resistance protein